MNTNITAILLRRANPRRFVDLPSISLVTTGIVNGATEVKRRSNGCGRMGSPVS